MNKKFRLDKNKNPNSTDVRKSKCKILSVKNFKNDGFQQKPKL